MTQAPDVNALFEGLTIEPTDEALPEPQRGGFARTAGPNPFEAPVKASVEHDKPYTFFIAPEGVQRATFLINSAARKQNFGVRIVVDVKRDKEGRLVKGTDGKAQYLLQTQGDNKGKVRIRLQAKAERKTQTTSRAYSLVKDRKKEGTYHVRDRENRVNIASGTHEAMKSLYADLNSAAQSQAAQARAAAILERLRNGVQGGDTATPGGTPEPTGEADVTADEEAAS